MADDAEIGVGEVHFALSTLKRTLNERLEKIEGQLREFKEQLSNEHLQSAERYTKLSEQQIAISEDVGLARRVLEERVASVAVTGELKGSQSMGTCTLCRNQSISKPLPLLQSSVCDINAVIPLLKVTCIVTVMRFAYAIENARSLVPENVWQGMSVEEEVSKNASGFSIFFFSARSGMTKKKYQTGAGKLWSLVQRKAMEPALKYAKRYIFRSCRDPPSSANTSGGGTIGQRPVEPQWLAMFRTEADIRSTLDGVLTHMESMKIVHGAASIISGGNDSFPSGGAGAVSVGSGDEPPRKRARQDDLKMTDADLRVLAVKQMRSSWRELVNGGRTEVRSFLHERLMFVVESICKCFRTVRLAKENGFEVVFYDDSGAEEINFSLEGGPAEAESEVIEDGEPRHAPPSMLPVPAAENFKNSIWDIPSAVLVTPEEARKSVRGVVKREVTVANEEVLDRLRKKFPSLSVKLRYMRDVIRESSGARGEESEGAAESEGSGPSKGMKKIDDEEVVSLHGIAQGMVMELFRVKSNGLVLSASGLSLKAIHIYAIALRALVRRTLGEDVYPLSDMERVAIGNMFHREVDKRTDELTSMLELGRGGRPNITRSLTNAKKLQISERDADKLIKKRQHDNAIQKAAEMRRQNVGVALPSQQAEQRMGGLDGDGDRIVPDRIPSDDSWFDGV